MSWITFTTSQGYVLDLDDRTALTLLSEVRGTVMSPFDVSTESLTEDLTRFQTVRAGKRTIELPILIRADSVAAMEAELDLMAKYLNPKKGIGLLTVTREDGSQRCLKCRYVSGLEGDYSEDAYGVVWQAATLNMQATDPYWYAVTQESESYMCEPAGRFFPAEDDTDGTFFPMTLSASTMVGVKTIHNGGDGPAWPIWIINGPGSELVLRNTFSQYDEDSEAWESVTKTLSLNIDLNESEQVVIDTRPGAKTVTKNDGTNLFSQVSETSALWPVAEGDNAIEIELNGTDSTHSQITLTFTIPYLKA